MAAPWRTTPLPANWRSELRPAVLERDDHRCTWTREDGTRCTEPGTDADHIGDPTDHSLDNLRLLCGYHHRKRTALQARGARGPLPSRRRQSEQHPGHRPPPPPPAALDADDIPPF